jgi:hypothetical protein
MEYFVIETKKSMREPMPGLIMDMGWGNGYVVIPENHSLFGKDYDELNEIVNVHGGLTFSEDLTNLEGMPVEVTAGWVVGFDTAHAGDTLDKWSEEDVKNETVRLREQLMSYYGD